MRAKLQLKRGVTAGALAAIACGAGILLVAWHADTLRLHPQGINLWWPLPVAFGAGWSARGSSAGRTAIAMLVGSFAGVVASFASLQSLPLTPLGTGSGLGIVATILAIASLASRGRLPLGVCAIAFGIGIAGTALWQPDTSSGVVDLVAVWTTTAFALVLGTLAAYTADTIRQHTRGSAPDMTGPAAMPAPPPNVIDLEDTISPDARHEAFGPMLQPPRRKVGAR